VFGQASPGAHDLMSQAFTAQSLTASQGIMRGFSCDMFKQIALT